MKEKIFNIVFLFLSVFLLLWCVTICVINTSHGEEVVGEIPATSFKLSACDDVSQLDVPSEEESSICEYSEEISIELSQEESVCEVSEETDESSVEEISEEDVSEEDVSDIKLMWYGDEIQVKVLNEKKKTVHIISVVIYNKNEDRLNFEDGKIFIEDIRAICATLDYDGIPLAAMLAQAYTEGGCGKQGAYRHSNNLFGIRAGGNWDGMVYARDLGKTFIDYQSARKAGGTDLFRAYECIRDSIQDYIDLITTSDLYSGALNRSTKQYLKYLVRHGYGSDYMVDTWMYLIKLYKLDK